MKHRSTELLQGAVCQLHLGLDANGFGGVGAACKVGDVVQQCALADAGLAPQDNDAALSPVRICYEPVEDPAFGLAAMECCHPDLS